MSVKLLLQYADISLLAVISVVLLIMWRKRLLSTNKALAGYLATALVLEAIVVPILFFRKNLGLDIDFAYRTLFFSTIIGSFIETVLMIVIIYGVFNAAMSPFKGLQRMGQVVFRWVAGVSILLMLVSAVSPHVLLGHGGATATVTVIIQRVQESTNVLTLCLLLFVSFSIKSLGLTYRSRLFGMTVGLGIISTLELIVAAWYSTTGAPVYSPIYLVNAVGYIAAFATWGVYFAVPEPAQRMLTLPTTSPFFHWNRIAEALGEEPGQVAISFGPSMFAPGEVKAMETINKFTLKRQAEAKAKSLAESQRTVELDDIAAS